jgi:uncharacterized delta-60 repeat protein
MRCALKSRLQSGSAATVAAAFVLMAATAAPAAGAPRPGSLDPGFGNGGLVIKPTPKQLGLPYRLIQTARSPGGKLVAAVELSDGEPMVIRYLVDGHLDRRFGQRGKVEIRFPGFVAAAFDIADLTVDASGRVVLAGAGPGPSGCSQCQLALLRLRPDGSLDPSFGEGGIANPDFGFGTLPAPPGSYSPPESELSAFPSVDRVQVDGSGRIVVAGTVITSYWLGKYLMPESMAAPMVGRVLEGGQVDSTFGIAGATVLGELAHFRAVTVFDLTVDGRERPTLAACKNPTFHEPPTGNAGVFRLNPDGSRDESIGPSGWRRTTWCPTAVALDPAKRLLVLLRPPCPKPDSVRCPRSLERWLADGSKDASFAYQGRLSPKQRRRTQVWDDVKVDGKGRIVLAGVAAKRSFGAFVPVALETSRWADSGAADRVFGKGGRVLTTFGRQLAWGSSAHLVLGSEGRILVAGEIAGRAPADHEPTALGIASYRGGS